MLVKNVQFSTKLSNITYEMDCLLVKKGQEIRDLEKKLEESPMRFSQNEMLTDFDIEMTIHDQPEILSESTTESTINVNVYVKTLPIQKLDAKRNPDGHFKCTECDYKTTRFYNYEVHFRTHTGERPFQCKLCEKAFRHKTTCISHIRMHDDRFKLKCSVCDAKFFCRQKIISHTQRKHNGESYTRKSSIFRIDDKKPNKQNLNTFFAFNFHFRN